ncbi:MAG: M48 family metallopeptidase [Reyranellales bacterium]
MPAPARYYDGQTASVQEVAVRPSAGLLIVFRLADETVLARWPFAELSVLGDIEHEAVPPIAHLGEEARLVIDDPELRRQLSSAVPQLAKLGVARPRPLPRIAKFGGALAALVVMFWGAVDYGSEFVAPLAPHSLQAKLGSSVFRELVADKTLCSGAEGLAAINGLANRLGKAANFNHPITVYIVKGGPLNAFTLPGGTLVFYSDLIDQAKDSSQVAGVLAHEIGHAVHYHPIKGLAHQSGVDLLLRLMTGGFTDLNTLASGGGLLLALRNGRAFEREADATGVALLEKLGLRADGIASFFEQMMANQPTDLAAVVGIWSDHPPTAERIAATKRPPTGKPAFSDAEWKALRSVCESEKSLNAPTGRRPK